MEISTLFSILLLSLLSGVTTIIGVVLAYWFNKSKRAVVIGIGFSTGMMLMLSLFELIPQAYSIVGIKALFGVFLGFIVLFLLHILIPHSHMVHNPKSVLTEVSILVAVGIMLHDLPEGFALASGYLINQKLGIFTALIIALHNIPEQFAMAVPLVMLRKKHLLFRIAILAMLAEPIGAMFGVFAVNLAPMLKPYLLAFAAGSMIFVSIDELWPLARRLKEPFEFFLGITIGVGIFLLLGTFF